MLDSCTLSTNSTAAATFRRNRLAAKRIDRRRSGRGQHVAAGRMRSSGTPCGTANVAPPQRVERPCPAVPLSPSPQRGTTRSAPLPIRLLALRPPRCLPVRAGARIGDNTKRGGNSAARPSSSAGGRSRLRHVAPNRPRAAEASPGLFGTVRPCRNNCLSRIVPPFRCRVWGRWYRRRAGCQGSKISLIAEAEAPGLGPPEIT
jgi:hypothetical protein